MPFSLFSMFSLLSITLDYFHVCLSCRFFSSPFHISSCHYAFDIFMVIFVYISSKIIFFHFREAKRVIFASRRLIFASPLCFSPYSADD